MFWPFKRFVPAQSKTKPGIYIERVETIWRNPNFPQEDTPGLEILRKAYWPSRVHWGGWPTNWHLMSWILHFWNEYDNWKDKDVQWAHGLRILGWEMEF